MSEESLILAENYDLDAINTDLSDEDDELTLCQYITSSSDEEDEEINLELLECEEAARSHNESLRERLRVLKVAMATLQEQLQLEKELCKREVEEMAVMQRRLHSSCTLMTTPTPITPSPGESAALRTQARNVAIAHYRSRLAEVEDMCHFEMLRIQHSVQTLHPLKVLVSEWSKTDSREQQGHGDVEEEKEKSQNDNTCQSSVSTDRELDAPQTRVGDS